MTKKTSPAYRASKEETIPMREFPVMMAKYFAASVSVQRKHSRTTAKLSAPALTKDMAGYCAPATVK